MKRTLVVVGEVEKSLRGHAFRPDADMDGVDGGTTLQEFLAQYMGEKIKLTLVVERLKE